MSLIGPQTITALQGFPRVSGDEPPAPAAKPKPAAFSPRERG